MIQTSLDSDSHVSDVSNLINIIAKYCILVITANVSTLIVTLWLILESALGVSLFGWFIISLDCFVKVLCVYLEFVFGNGAFNIICHPCN